MKIDMFFFSEKKLIIEKMKGVSDIIATILMLVITIGMAGTAYVYISGMLTGKTASTISLIDYSCSNTSVRVINLVVSNDGTTTIASGAMTIFVDNQDRTTDFGAFSGGAWGAANKDIASHTTKPILTNPGGNPAWLNTPGQKNILVSTASNAQRVTVLCP